MTETIQYARKVGGSLMVRIPKEIADFENIHSGEMVRVEIKKVPLDCFGMFPSLGSFKKEDKIDIKWNKFEHHG
ncbi:AbrB/MazE/SpoVT family DNA-binding domain-containing protein [Candidatus Woesearchaeota archaeon]|nr:AbrB/MazE/SpoVT family DNA-binding domain-containing protein [Candidatus Woesearchaeota archaeon]